MPYANFVKNPSGTVEVEMTDIQPLQVKEVPGMLGYVKISLSQLDLKKYLEDAFHLGVRRGHEDDALR